VEVKRIRKFFKRMEEERSNSGRFQKRYRLKPGWRKKKVVIDANLLQKCYDENIELKRIKKILAVPYSERRKRARLAIETTELPRILKEMDKLQKEIEVGTELLIGLDKKMRKLEQKADYIRCKSVTAKVPTDYELKWRLKRQMKLLQQSVERQMQEASDTLMRKQQGFSSPIKAHPKKKGTKRNEPRKANHAVKAGTTEAQESPG